MNPYESQPPSAFWKPSVADRSMFDIDGLWAPKWVVPPRQPVATFGSCFAQYIGNALAARKYNWLITERPPHGLSADNALAFNYGVFTCRTGNIYTTSLLKQWTQWALGKTAVPGEVWEKGGRFYDPFRPRVEPNGFESQQEVRASLAQTIGAFRNAIEQCRQFVFTLGLTESWVNARHGYEYPMCPGTVAGEHDPAQHTFVNQDFATILRNLTDAIAMMSEVNPHIRFILTVSPVPLTATMSGRHVLVATMHSKSILRAVAGQLATEQESVDYFPSYEIINSPAFRGTFFEPNLRNVNPAGVTFVMNSFFACQEATFGAPRWPKRPADGANEPAGKGAPARRTGDVCEEELLAAFGKGAAA